MKKIAILLVFIIIFTSIPLMPLAAGYVDTLRVGISYGNSSSGEAWFYSDNPINVVDAYSLSYITSLPQGVKCKIQNVNGALQSDYFSPTNYAIRLESITPIYYNDLAYRGSFELRSYEEKITVINIVNTEDYLASLLGREMSASWPVEALKAQAVCARNYAVTTIGKHSAYGFDLCATTDCQVYGGIASEAESTRRAVNETRGVTVTYNGKIVPLYYFSCDGGYTEDSENVWVSAEGYLRGKQDVHESSAHAKNYNWSVTMTKEEIEKAISAKGINVGELLDVRIDSVSKNNGVTKLTFVGTLGESSVTKSKTRTVLSLKSQAYTITKNDSTGNSVVASTGHSSEALAGVLNALTASGLYKVEEPVHVLSSSGISQLGYNAQSGAGAHSSYTFNGHGWGHLVGMSQWGAYSMALNGYTYKDILNFYFTDIVISG